MKTGRVTFGAIDWSSGLTSNVEASGLRRTLSVQIQRRLSVPAWPWILGLLIADVEQHFENQVCHAPAERFACVLLDFFARSHSLHLQTTKIAAANPDTVPSKNPTTAPIST